MSRCEIDIENEIRELNSKNQKVREQELEDDEWAQMSVSIGKKNPVEIFKELDTTLSAYYPHIFKRS